MNRKAKTYKGCLDLLIIREEYEEMYGIDANKLRGKIHRFKIKKEDDEEIRYIKTVKLKDLTSPVTKMASAGRI